MTDAIPQTIIVLNPDGKAFMQIAVALEYTDCSLDEVQTRFGTVFPSRRR